MPIYDYACDACGPFTARRPMAQFSDPCDCPECGVGASRAFLRAPAILSGGPGRRVTGGAVEAGASPAPGASTAHPAGCGCCMRRRPLPGALSAGSRVFTAHGPVRRGGP